ncbi:MAG TPA: M28 family peptidase, partial [Chitinophagaceae bacterium]|nr:M28 family peptidase [Chitinophagaceae bacterium]
RKNLNGSNMKILSDNFDTKGLFQRSDNYSFFQKHIVAHSIMCSDDTDPCYHESCDVGDRINFKNMTELIRAIIISCASLIDAKDTPKLK